MSSFLSNVQLPFLFVRNLKSASKLLGGPFWNINPNMSIGVYILYFEFIKTHDQDKVSKHSGIFV